MTARDPITALIVRTLRVGAWLQARPGGRLWCSDPALLPPELRHDLRDHHAGIVALLELLDREGLGYFPR